MIINHVMTKNVHSRIFDDILGYFIKYDRKNKYVISIDPIQYADVYHYHRPHFEKNIKYNSVVTVHHDLYDLDKSLEFENFVSKYKKCKKVVCLNFGQKYYLERVGITNTSVVPHGYNDEIFKNIKTNESRSRFVCGIFSKKYDRKFKGEMYLYEMLKRIDNSRISFLLVGDGRNEEAEIARSLGFECKVYEYLPYKVFNDLYANIDCLLMLSHFEGGPANIPEAVATATPVVGFNIGMVPDVIEDGVNGKILTGDYYEDAIIFENLFGEKKEILNIKEYCHSKRGNVITWQENINKYTEIYNQICK